MTTEAAEKAPSVPQTKQIALADVNVDRMDREMATALCTQHPDIAGQFIMALIAQNTAALPGTAFVRRGGEGGVYLKKQMANFRLTESEGHLIGIPKRYKDGNTWKTEWSHTFSMAGLRKLNELPALQIIRPSAVIVDGVEQMNPYIQVNEKTRMPEVVYARCLCVGYAPMGSLVATDVTIRLDVNIYLLENIQSKMKSLKDNSHRLARYGVEDEYPTDQRGEEQVKAHGQWRFMPLHSVGGIGLWINLAAPECHQILGDHTTRLKFIERLAQSFCERNAMKAHPSMPKTVQAVNGVANIRMTGWTSDFSRDEIDKLREMVEKDKLHEFQTASGEGIDVTAVDVTDLDEEDREAMNEEADREKGADGQHDDDEEAPAPELDPDDMLPKATEAYSKLVELQGRAKAKKTLEGMGIANLEEAESDKLDAFIKSVETLLTGD